MHEKNSLKIPTVFHKTMEDGVNPPLIWTRI